MVKHEAEYENGGAGLIGFLAGIGYPHQNHEIW